MRFFVAPLAIAAALAFAGAAQAQDHDSLEYRVVAANSVSAALVSTNVSGPQNARRLTNIMMAVEPGGSGADNFVSDVLVNCQTGEIEYLKSAVYADGQLLAELPSTGERRVPAKNTMDDSVVTYACTGKVHRGDTPRVRGLAAARAQGRAAMAQ